jgi:hypothetical protein
MEAVAVKTKICTKCGGEKVESEFRTHKSGFVLNQCKECERAATKARRLAKASTPAPAVEEVTVVTVKTKSGKLIEASTIPLAGGRKASSPNSDKVLYFASGVTRDTARIAFSAFAGVPTTGILCPMV